MQAPEAGLFSSRRRVGRHSVTAFSCAHLQPPPGHCSRQGGTCSDAGRELVTEEKARAGLREPPLTLVPPPVISHLP